MASQVLDVLGNVLQVGGLLFLGYGIRNRLRRLDALALAATRIRGALLARPDPPPRKPALVTVGADLVVEWSVRASGQTPFSLPDIGADPDGFAAAVRTRLNELTTEVDELRHSAAADRELQRRDVEGVREELGGEVNEVRAENNRNAIKDLGPESGGFLLLLLGIVLNAIASLIAAT
jgi:hypothetical protein